MTTTILIAGIGVIILGILLLVPMGRNLIESYRAMRDAERLHREHLEFRKRKDRERR